MALTLLLHALLLAYFQRYGGELEAESLARYLRTDIPYSCLADPRCLTAKGFKLLARGANPEALGPFGRAARHIYYLDCAASPARCSPQGFGADSEPTWFSPTGQWPASTPLASLAQLSKCSH